MDIWLLVIHRWIIILFLSIKSFAVHLVTPELSEWFLKLLEPLICHLHSNFIRLWTSSHNFLSFLLQHSSYISKLKSCSIFAQCLITSQSVNYLISRLMAWLFTTLYYQTSRKWTCFLFVLFYFIFSFYFYFYLFRLS